MATASKALTQGRLKELKVDVERGNDLPESVDTTGDLEDPSQSG